MEVVGVKQISVIEGAVFYVDPKSAGSLGFLGGKERVRIPLTEAHFSLEALKKHIVDYAGLKTEAEKRGVGSSIEVKLFRLAKTPEGTKAFSINTQAQWDVERPLFGESSVLQVNVLKREVVFAKDSPVIKITLAADSGASSSQTSEQQQRKRQQGGGRKRSATKLEDDKLVKRLKLGETVARNERQLKMLEDLNLALESMSNSKAINEFTIRCGRCDKLKIVPTDRTPQAKAQYFKKKHYDSACQNRQIQDTNAKKNSATTAGMQKNMDAFLKKCSKNLIKTIKWRSNLKEALHRPPMYPKKCLRRLRMAAMTVIETKI
ncbi:uncharacterized protein LOC144658037 [Oculina patagonica]